MTADAVFGLLLAHLLGDYVVQSRWMATEKTQRWWPAIVHAVTYGVPFLMVTRSPLALAVIVGTHAVIDRYRLAGTWSGPRTRSARRHTVHRGRRRPAPATRRTSPRGWRCGC